ncbi:MAG: hypothetical protein HQ582_32300 [Planctomycetes bacterium]|nr:hypothetical protein [Planctomycetota bacterium]
MKYRQHLLAAVFGAMLLWFGGEWLVDNALRGPLDARRREKSRLEETIKKLKEEQKRIAAAKTHLAKSRSQSLPSDPELARSLYQAWLVELVERVRFSSPSVNSFEPVTRRVSAKGTRNSTFYHTLSFSMRGRGTLEQVTEFLYAFYRTDVLHQIRTILISPLREGDQLDLSVTIDALALPEAPTKDEDKAPTDLQAVYDVFAQRVQRTQEGRLASLELSDYHPIVTRNLFAIAGAHPDPLEHTYFTSVNIVDGSPRVWFTLRTSDKILKLGEGEDFQVGQFRGTIAEIEGSDVIIQSEDERWLLTLGERLTDAAALPPEF